MNYFDFGIIIPNGRTTGEVQVICPNCSHTRKKKTDKCLSVNLDKAVWNCHHCDFTGVLKSQIEKIDYVLPKWENKTELSDKAVKWFESRRISQATLSALKVTEGLEFMPQVGKEVNTIHFNYFRGEQLVNVKYRDGAKNFKLHKGSELIPYNLNAFTSGLDVFITEGEVDTLSLIESGLNRVISIPNGANLNNNNLACFDAIAEELRKCPKIHLCFDNDTAGRKLRDDFADRFGRGKCDFVVFKDCKDANECLINYGVFAVKECCENPFQFPLEGVYTSEGMIEEMIDLYNNGLKKPATIGMSDFDRLLGFEKGYITIVTGIPSHGKSDWVDQMALRLVIGNNWKGAFYSPENKPTRLHLSKMIRKITGKAWWGEGRLNADELFGSITYLDEKVWFVKPKKDFTLETILDLVRDLIVTKGLDFFVIDAWNKLDHKYSQNETKYIGESLDTLANFCEQYNVHCFLVAHPTKMRKQKDNPSKYEVPTLYDISGSANFYNKADNGICVYRDFDTNKSTVIVQKVKFQHWGETGYVEYNYDKYSGRYVGQFDNLDSWI